MTENRYLTRDEAIQALYEFVNSGVIAQDLEGAIEDIIACIEHEKDGLHTWGADAGKVVKLYTAYREDLWTDELKNECEEIHAEYAFSPAPFEREELEKDCEVEDDND